MTVRELEMICVEAIAQNGWRQQAVVALEELSEAQKEICKCLRGQGNKDHLAEEIADAIIMLKQMELVFGLTGSVGGWIIAKAQRLAERLKEGGY